MHKLKKYRLAFILLAVTLSIEFCFSEYPMVETAPPTEIKLAQPVPSGNFAVGRQLTYLSDETRAEPATSTGKRELALWIYYPAAASKQSAEETILPEAWAARYRPQMERKLGKAAADALLSLKASARSGATAAPSENAFPVLIFAPGANWLPTDYSTILENLASNGYVVIAFAAAPLSPVVQYWDGRIVESPRVSDSTYGLIGADFNFIASWAEKLNQDSSLRIANRLDVNRIGVFGHSIGGAAAILAAGNNAKIKAAINLDGDFGGDSENAAPKQAILYLSTQPPSLSDETPFENWDAERNEIRRKSIWEKINAQSETAFRVRAAKMFHSNFQDAALLPPASMPENLRANRYGSIDGERGVKLTTELIVAFFDTQLKSVPLANFLEIEKKYPEIRIEKR